MAHYNVVIETREQDGGKFRADVVSGPEWARSCSLTDDISHIDAALFCRMRVRDYGRLLDPKCTFDFLHVQSDTERD